MPLTDFPLDAAGTDRFLVRLYNVKQCRTAYVVVLWNRYDKQWLNAWSTKPVEFMSGRYTNIEWMPLNVQEGV